MTDVDLRVRISGDARDLEKILARSERLVNAFAGRVERQSRSANSELSSLARLASGSLTTAVGNLAAGAFRGLTGSISEAVREVGRAETAFAEVATIADRTAFPLERIREISRDLSTAFGQSIATEARSLYQAISAGATTSARALELLDASNRLAIGGVADLEVVIDGVSTAVNAFRSQNLSAADAGDVFFKTVELGKTRVDELAASIGQVAPIANQLGIPFATLGASIATITQSGLATSEAITQVRSLLVSVIRPSADAAKVAEDLGINWTLAEFRSRGLRGFLEYVEESGASEEQIAKLTGRVEGLSAILNLSGKNAETFDRTLRGLEERSGAVDSAFRQISSTLTFQIGRFDALRSAAFESLGVTLTRSGPVKDSIVAINDALEDFIDFLESPEGQIAVDAFFGTISRAIAGAIQATLGLRRAFDDFLFSISTEFGITLINDDGSIGETLSRGDQRLDSPQTDALERLAEGLLAAANRPRDPPTATGAQESDEAEGRARDLVTPDSSGSSDGGGSEDEVLRRNRDRARQDREAERRRLEESLEELTRFLATRRETILADYRERAEEIARIEESALNPGSEAIGQLRERNDQRLSDDLAGVDEDEARAQEEAERDRQRLEERLERLRGFFTTRREEIALDFQARTEELAELREAGVATEDEFRSLRLDAEKDFQREMAQLDRERLEESIQLEARTARQRLSIAKTVANGLISLVRGVAGESKAVQIAALVVEKGFAIAEVAINTQVASAKAAAQLGIYSGPAIAALQVQGALQIAAIAATTIGGVAQIATGGGSGVSAAAGSAIPAQAEPEGFGPADRGGDLGSTVQLLLTGDAEIDKFLDLLADRINSGDRVIFSRESRQAEELLA